MGGWAAVTHPLLRDLGINRGLLLNHARLLYDNLPAVSAVHAHLLRARAEQLGEEPPSEPALLAAFEASVLTRLARVFLSAKGAALKHHALHPSRRHPVPCLPPSVPCICC